MSVCVCVYLMREEHRQRNVKLLVIKRYSWCKQVLRVHNFHCVVTSTRYTTNKVSEKPRFILELSQKPEKIARITSFYVKKSIITFVKSLLVEHWRLFGWSLSVFDVFLFIASSFQLDAINFCYVLIILFDRIVVCVCFLCVCVRI